MTDASDKIQDKHENIEEIKQEANKPKDTVDKKIEENFKSNKSLDNFMQSVKKMITPTPEELNPTQQAEKIMADQEKAREEAKKKKVLAKGRIIDTSKERGINEEQLFMKARAYLEKHRAELTPEQIAEWEQKANDEEDQERLDKEEQKEIKRIQETKGTTKEIAQELNVSPEEIFAETEARLQKVISKDKRGETLNKEEMQMLVLHTQILKAEGQLQQRLASAEEINANRMKIDNDLRTRTIKEYEKIKKTNPELIIKNQLGPKQEGFVVGKNFWKSMGFIISTHWAMKYGYVKLVKIWKDRGVEEIYLKKMPKFVEFWSKNERGEDQVNICKVRVMNYRLMGTTVPICYAVEGFIDAYDFFGDMRDEYTQELFQKALLLGYWSGVLKGKETFPDQKEESFWKKYRMILLIAGLVVIILVGIAYMQYQQTTEMKEQIDLLTTLLKASQIDANAIIIKGSAAVAGVGA